MEQFLYTLLTMSLSAGLVALVVMAVRFFLPKLPRALVCLLWLAVFFRMVCPASFQLPVSLVPRGIADGSAAQFVLSSSPPAADPASQGAPPTEAPDQSPSPAGQEAPAPGAQAAAPTYDPLPLAPPLWPKVVFGGWAAGTLVALTWAGVCYRRFHRRTAEAVKVEGNLYETDLIPSPFVLGILHPKIYLPLGLAGQDRRYVLLHEEAHIRRGDHLTKPLAYCILCFHWFNPVLGVAYRLLCLDIETACDQAVLRQFDQGEEGDAADYAAALLHLSREPGVPSAVPLAFGEEDAKERIEVLLQYKRPVAWVLSIALAVCLLVTICLAADPEEGTYRLGGHFISQGAMVSQGEAISLPDSLLQELVSVLGDTHHSRYTPCEDPGLPEGTILLSRPDSPVEYRLLTTQVSQPWLVQVRHGAQGDTCRMAQLDGDYSHYAKYTSNTVYHRWVDWWEQADALLPHPSAQELYDLAPASADDLDAARVLLDALGVRKAVGDYTLQFQARPGQHKTLVLAPETSVTSAAQRQWADRALRSLGLLFLSVTPEVDDFAWYHPDNGVGFRVDRSGLPASGDGLRLWPLEAFQYLYPQRHLWWWENVMSLPNYTTVSGIVYYVFHPAYTIGETLYSNSTSEGLVLGYCPYFGTPQEPGEFILSPFLSPLYTSTRAGMPDQIRNSFLQAYAPLTDYTVADPAHHPEDLLAGHTVLNAWYLYHLSEPATGEEYEDHSLWSDSDTGYRIYQADDGLYLAYWYHIWGTDQWYLEYFFRLEEQLISTTEDVYLRFSEDDDSHPTIYELEGEQP